IALALLPAAVRAEVVLLTQPEVPQYAQVTAAFQQVRPETRTVDFAAGAPTLRDGDVLVAVGSKAFELARGAPGTFVVVVAAVLNPDLGGRDSRDRTSRST